MIWKNQVCLDPVTTAISVKRWRPVSWSPQELEVMNDWRIIQSCLGMWWNPTTELIPLAEYNLVCVYVHTLFYHLFVKFSQRASYCLKFTRFRLSLFAFPVCGDTHTHTHSQRERERVSFYSSVVWHTVKASRMWVLQQWNTKDMKKERKTKQWKPLSLSVNDHYTFPKLHSFSEILRYQICLCFKLTTGCLVCRLK